MSVPKSKRNQSNLEFLNNAARLRREITDLLLRDFGMRDKVRKVEAYTKGMDAEDAAAVEAIAEKYGRSPLADGYPEWFISEMRSEILALCNQMLMDIEAANSVYATSESEYRYRRLRQDDAICCCEQLLQEMKYVIDVLPIDANRFGPHVEGIVREIALLKGWRKKDNAILRRLRGAEGNGSPAGAAIRVC